MRRGGRPAVRARRLGPGEAQPQQVSLPGGTDFVTAAEPDGNLDLYLTPDGDPDRTFELTQTPSDSNASGSLPDGRSVVYAVDAADGSSDLYLMTLDDRQRPVRSERLLERPREPVRDELVARRNTAARSIGHGARRQPLSIRLRHRGPAAVPRERVQPRVVTGRTERRLREHPRERPHRRGRVRRGRGRVPPPARRRHGLRRLLPRLGAGGEPARVRQRGPGGDLDVFVVNLDGSGLTILTADHDGYDEPVLWAPERLIVFISDRAGDRRCSAT